MSVSVVACPVPVLQFFDNTGSPAVGGTVLTQVGGVNYATYEDSAGNTPLPNPIPLNSRGEVSNASGASRQLFLAANTAYTFTLYDAGGNLLNESTYINGVSLTAAGIAALTSAITDAPVLNSQERTAAEVAASVTPTNYSIAVANAFRYGVDGTGTTDSTAALQKWINASWVGLTYASPWNGSNGANLIPTLPPSRVQVNGSTVLPCNITLAGLAHPANTESHTRIIMNSTGVTPARTWSASTPIPSTGRIQPTPSNGYYYSANNSGSYWAGTTGASQPTWPTTISSTVVDGTVTWTCSALVSATDNRNTPIFKFSRATTLGGGTLADQNLNMSVERLEFWYVVPGGTFTAPLSGASNTLGDYPLGGTFYFDCDVNDTRIVSCCFQNSPCVIRINNARSGTTGGDGFANTYGVNLWVEECEFDTGVHIYATNSYLDLVFRNCAFYNGIHKYVGCTGRVVYENCRFYGGAFIDASDSGNSFDVVRVAGGEFDQSTTADSISVYGATILDVKGITWAGQTALSTIVGNHCNAGAINNNSINDSGFNSSSAFPPSTWTASTAYASGAYVLPTVANHYYYVANPGGTSGASQPTWPTSVGASVSDGSVTWTCVGYIAQALTAAVKLIDCQNLCVQGNNITATDSASYNGFGILTLSSARTSQKNFISGNCISAPYTGALYNGQERRINIASSADVVGQNYDPNGWVVAKQGPVATTRVVVTYSASMTLDASTGNEFDITISNTTAYAVNAPTNPSEGQIIVIMLRNTSGGVVGTGTWNSVFKLYNGGGFAPQNGGSLSFALRYDGTNWVELWRSANSVPN